MPIYEFACPKCRVIFNFLSKRVQNTDTPACPKCGNKEMVKQMSSFATPKGLKESGGDTAADSPEEMPTPNFDDPKVMRVMSEMERDMAHLDENNPKHMAHMMRKMKDILPPGAMPKEMDVAIKRLESGEDPEKIEEDMGEALDGFLGGPEGEGEGGYGGGGGYSHDSGLYDY